ncbi:hypothetical protein C0J52_04963 [Blattella germanica]|nr:hypothetical protein C0J52_04963 [Blattella germanica]
MTTTQTSLTREEGACWRECAHYQRTKSTLPALLVLLLLFLQAIYSTQQRQCTGWCITGKKF